MKIGRDTGLSDEQARQAWQKGWNSASSVAEKAIQELLANVAYRPETLSYTLNEEALSALKDRVQSGLYKELRIAERGGLDYYFANSKPQTILGGKAV